MIKQVDVYCPYCGAKAEFFSQKEFYGEDYGGHLYVCQPCDARVTTHKKTGLPVGTMANWELRKLRMDAHDALDPIWKNPFNKYTRTNVYIALAELLDLPVEGSHIGMLNVSGCNYVIWLVRTGKLQAKLDEMEQEKQKRKQEQRLAAKAERKKELAELAKAGKQENNLTTKKIPDDVKLYGIFSTVSKKYCFGIQEPSKSKAMKALFKRIGKDAHKYRFETRRIKYYAK